MRSHYTVDARYTAKAVSRNRKPADPRAVERNSKLVIPTSCFSSVARKVADRVNEVYVFRNEVEIERMDTCDRGGGLRLRLATLVA